MEIRRLTEADVQALWELRLTALRTEPQSFGESVEEHLQLPTEAFARRLHSTGDEGFVLGAIFNGRLVGMVGFYRDAHEKRRHRGWIWGVYVAPECRGQGAGHQMLMEAIRRAAIVPGLERVLLSVGANQSSARRLYERCGFAVYGREPQALQVNGELFDEDLMTLNLRHIG